VTKICSIGIQTGQLRIHLLDELGIHRLARGRTISVAASSMVLSTVCLPNPLVGPGRALGLAGAVPDRGRNGRVVAVLVPAGGEVEGVLVIDLLEKPPPSLRTISTGMPISPSDCWMKVDHSEMSSPHGAGSSFSETVCRRCRA